MTNLLRKALLLAAFVYAQTAGAQSRADGLAAMQLEDWDKAISIYTALTKADPTDQDAFLYLSNAYLARSEKVKALAEKDKTQADKDRAQADKAKALEVAQTAFAAKPEAPLAFVANARVLLLGGKSAEASEQFKRASTKAKKDIKLGWKVTWPKDENLSGL